MDEFALCWRRWQGELDRRLPPFAQHYAEWVMTTRDRACTLLATSSSPNVALNGA
jgi:hypothetical protein